MGTTFVLLWMATSGAGVMTSGSAEFQSRPACEAAEKVLRGQYGRLAVKLPTGSGVIGLEIACVPKG